MRLYLEQTDTTANGEPIYALHGCTRAHLHILFAGSSRAKQELVLKANDYPDKARRYLQPATELETALLVIPPPRTNG
jgi:hypothetical protein